MTLIDTDNLTERCNICGQLIIMELNPEPIVMIGSGKITFSYDPEKTANNLSVMHHSCYLQVRACEQFK